MKEKPIQFELKTTLNRIFSSSQMENFTLKAGSMFLSKTFQFIIVEKCYIQIIFYNLTKTFAYAISQIKLAALVMMLQY